MLKLGEKHIMQSRKMRLKLVVFDVDDVLWPLGEIAARRAGVPFEKLVEFDTTKNLLLTPDERAALIAAYCDLETWRQTKFFDGYKELLQLEQYGAAEKLCSNSFTLEITQFKHDVLLASIPGLTEEHLDLRTVNYTQTAIKRLEETPLIRVDDCPYHIAASQARYDIMPFAPWNQSTSAQKVLRGHDHFGVRLGDLKGTIDLARTLLIRAQQEDER